MLKSIAGMNRKYLPSNLEAETFVAFIESLDENQWSLLVENVPEAIASADPLCFGRFDEVTPDDLQLILNNTWKALADILQKKKSDHHLIQSLSLWIIAW